MENSYIAKLIYDSGEKQSDAASWNYTNEDYTEYISP